LAGRGGSAESLRRTGELKYEVRRCVSMFLAWKSNFFSKKWEKATTCDENRPKFVNIDEIVDVISSVLQRQILGVV
jgi:hypothetical protein